MTANSVDDALIRRFLFVTGKGGVGKTTVVAALAERFARQGKRVLVAETSAKEHLSALFGRASLPTQITELSPRLYGVLLDADVALKEYGAIVLRSERLVSALFDNKLVRGFFHGAPGLKEWAALGKAWYHSTEVLDDGSPRFDVVILDAPATGHSLDMLRVPKTIVELSPPGVLRTDAERAWTQFRDPAQSGVVVVTLPEEMPVNESLELCQALQGELGLPLLALVINQVVPELLTALEVDELAVLEEPTGPDPAEQALASGIRRAAREKVQTESLERLRAIAALQLRLPYLPEGVSSLAALTQLAAAMG
ncbi:MAG TPA: ArsA family ATPase [Polyangiaceae bacterium]|nr:ArsA family ATPase [Polyangiaceae bacterium]